MFLVSSCKIYLGHSFYGGYNLKIPFLLTGGLDIDK